MHPFLKQQNVLSLDRAHDSVFVWRGGILLKKGIRCAGLVFNYEMCVSTGNPCQSAALVSIMVPCHNTLKPDPYSATLFMSSTLSFVLSSQDKMCHINVSPEGLESSFLFYKIFTDLHLIICTYHSLQYFKERVLKIHSQETVAPIIFIYLCKSSPHTE